MSLFRSRVFALGLPLHLALCSSLAACSSETTPLADAGALDATTTSGDGGADAIVDASGADAAPGDAVATDAAVTDAAVTDVGTRDAAASDAGAGDAASSGDGGACSTPAGRVSLPADDAMHPMSPVEWWYWTGHVQGPNDAWYGFEYAFFHVVQGAFDAQMVHHALTDVGGQRFHYKTNVAFGAPPAVPNGFELSVAGMTATGGGGHDVLHGAVDGYTLDLELRDLKAPVLQHGDGYTDYAFGGNTYYYSRPRMSAEGTLTSSTGAVPVHGRAWFDHQWGEIQTAISIGWDWFGIQLDDDREIMLFIVRDQGQDVLVGGSYNDASCQTTELMPADFQLTPTGTWTASDGCTYPAAWTLVIRGMTLTIVPVLPNQEIRSTEQRYFEGASLVSGDATGRAYVELTGYCH